MGTVVVLRRWRTVELAFVAGHREIITHREFTFHYLHRELPSSGV